MIVAGETLFGGEMMGLFKKKVKTQTYDHELYKPVLRCSICTGEQAAGFLNKQTGEFKEVCLITNEKALRSFMETYGLTDIEKIY